MGELFRALYRLSGPVLGPLAGSAEKAPHEVRRRGGETSARAGVRTLRVGGLAVLELPDVGWIFAPACDGALRYSGTQCACD